MSTTETTTQTRTQRIPKIIFERPGFDRRRFVLFLLVGILVGLLVGLILWATQGLGGENGSHVPAVYEMRDTWKYLPAILFVSVLAALGLGWGWKRQVSPRIEMVEVSVSSRDERGRRTRTSQSRAVTRYTR